ncbi:MAG: hypothetical protein QXM27_02795 [Candidatus Pacearchaeota archaeon]
MELEEDEKKNKMTLEKVIDRYGENVDMIVVYEPLLINDEVVDDDSPYVFVKGGWLPQIPFNLFNEIVEDFEITEDEDIITLEITLKPKKFKDS